MSDSEQLSRDLASLRIDRTAPADDGPRPVRAVVTGVVVVATLGGLGTLAWPHVEARIFKTEVAVTEVGRVSPSQALTSFSATGYVVPQLVSKVGAKVSGRIAKVHVKEGDVVEAGQLLAELEDADLRSATRAAESRVAVARARARTARAQLAEVRQQAERERGLVERGVSARAVLEDLEARAASAEEGVRAAESEIPAALAEVERLEVSREDMLITAPIAGTVVTKPVEAGELVGAQVGTILELADFRSLLVETDVPEGRLSRVTLGGPTEIVLDAFPDKRHRGEVAELGYKVNRAKATVVVKVKFAETVPGVLPEMSARVSFLSAALSQQALEEKPKIVVPASAVVERGGRRVVFVVDGDTARETPVVTGAAAGTRLELMDGPPPGTRLVALPPATLVDRAPIKPKLD